MSTTVIVGEGGELRFVHDDAVLELLELLGPARADRASTVEPDGENVITWVADLRPVGGPRGRFMTRTQALAWEKQWIEEHGIPTPIR